jgi:hypothetical protein
MDNIQKMIVGSLGLVGLIVILVPNSDPLAAKKTEVGQVTPGTPAPALPPPLPPQPAEVGNTSGGFVVDDSDIANPTPPGQRNQQATPEQIQPTQPQQFDNNAAQTQNIPGSYGQQPAVSQNSGLTAGLPPPT